MIAKTDSDIRHVTPSGGNVFADLGFDKQDAEKFYADSLSEIENTLAIKEQLMEEITLWITRNQMKQAEVATVLHISR
ncbi:helix-turn-helix domain-containing protein, partial [Salmonella enterica]